MSAQVRVLWAPQAGPQHALVRCPLPEVFYGGARGGGKTYGVLGHWLLKESIYGKRFNARMFRRSLVASDDAIQAAIDIYCPAGARFTQNPPRFVMPNGGRVAFDYLDNVQDAKNQQGKNLSDVWIEEAGQYPDSAPIDMLFGALRSAEGVPVQMILTANPGGPGQAWLRERYKLHPFPKQPMIVPRIVKDRGGQDKHIHDIAVIPSRLTDNKILLTKDGSYEDRLHLVGSPELVKAWLEGDWSAIEGAFFPEWSEQRHVIAPFEPPAHWLRFRSADWGSAKPFSVGWWAVASDDVQHDGRVIPRGALVRYREWYGCVPGKPNTGLKLTAEEVARGIKERSGDEAYAYSVMDPAAFAEDGGPSIAERMFREGVHFDRADNKRVGTLGHMGGWDMLRQRLKGDEDGRAMIFIADTCKDTIRTLPMLQHDAKRPEDLDSEMEDHCFTGDTLVRVRSGLRSLSSLIGTTGEIVSSDCRWHAYRSARLIGRDKPTVRLKFSDGSEVTCTPDHLFMTDRGWTQAADLEGQQIQCAFPTSARNSRASDIICAGNISNGRAGGFIGRFGERISGQSRAAIMSITRTTIDRTMQPAIWNASVRSSICLAGMAPKVASEGDGRSRRPLPRRLFGMGPRPATLGTKNITRSTAGQPSRPPSMIASVSSAAARISTIAAGFARTSASPHGVGRLAWMTRRALARLAGRIFGPANIPGSRHAQGRAEWSSGGAPSLICESVKPAPNADVFCLTVPATGNFTLANGAVVSNCADEVRYGCMSRPWVRPTPQPEPAAINTQAPSLRSIMAEIERGQDTF